MTTTAPDADELNLLRTGLRDALAILHPGHPDDDWPQSWKSTWNALAQLGIWSTIEPPDGSLTAAVVVAEELGRALYPGPAYEYLAAAWVLPHIENRAAIKSVADGTPPVALWTADSPPQRFDPAVGVSPDTLLFVVTGDGQLLAVPAAETHIEPVHTLDASRDVVTARVDTDAVAVLSDARPDLARSARTVKTLLYCADTLGCIECVLSKTAEYALHRTTFGSPIGTNQAVAHRLVDHAVTAQQIRLLLDSAVAAHDKGADDIALRVATVETLLAAKAPALLSDCIQLTGAIGFTWEFGHHFYLRRALTNATLRSGPGRPAHRVAEEAQW